MSRKPRRYVLVWYLDFDHRQTMCYHDHATRFAQHSWLLRTPSSAKARAGCKGRTEENSKLYKMGQAYDHYSPSPTGFPLLQPSEPCVSCLCCPLYGQLASPLLNLTPTRSSPKRDRSPKRAYSLTLVLRERSRRVPKPASSLPHHQRPTHLTSLLGRETRL